MKPDFHASRWYLVGDAQWSDGTMENVIELFVSKSVEKYLEGLHHQVEILNYAGELVIPRWLRSSHTCNHTPR